MGTLVKTGVMFFLILGLIVLIYLAIRGVSSWNQGYSWHEMDWEQSGHTSVDDFFEASDIGRRSINHGGKKCLEYYSYKDGMPVKTVCAK